MSHCSVDFRVSPAALFVGGTATIADARQDNAMLDTAQLILDAR
jgi:hypothetical protein